MYRIRLSIVILSVIFLWQKGKGQIDSVGFDYLVNGDSLLTRTFSILEDADHRIWIGSFGYGISMFDGYGFQHFDGFSTPGTKALNGNICGLMVDDSILYVSHPNGSSHN